MPFLTTSAGHRLHYHDRGEGRPVVMLSAAMMGGEMWETQVPFLVEHGLRCLTYDRRGNGRSDAPADGYGYDHLAADLADLFEHLDLQEAVLVGYAIGGGEAVRYLVRHGTARVAKLALVATTTPLIARSPDHPEGLDPTGLEQVTQAIRKDREGWLRGFIGPFFGGSATDPPDALPVPAGLAERHMRLALEGSLDAQLALQHTLFATDQRAEIARLRLPTLIVHGTADQGAPYALCGRRTAELLPHATFLTYRDATHGLYATHADRLNDDLLAFCAA